MGMRISKNLGWGLTLPYEEFERVVNENFREKDFSNYDLKDERHLIPSGVNLSSVKGSDVVKVIDHSEDDGCCTLLIQSISQHQEWSRHDDIIDYYDDDSNDMATKIKPLFHGIFPWNVSLVLKKNNQPLSEEIQMYLEVINEKNCHEEFTVKWMNDNGFTDYHDFRGSIKAKTPGFVYDIASYLDLFNDSDCVDRLEPMLITSWE